MIVMLMTVVVGDIELLEAVLWSDRGLWTCG